MCVVVTDMRYMCYDPYVYICSYVATHIIPSHFLWHMMVCLAVAVLMRQATTYQELVAAQHCEVEFPDYYD